MLYVLFGYFLNTLMRRHGVTENRLLENNRMEQTVQIYSPRNNCDKPYSCHFKTRRYTDHLIVRLMMHVHPLKAQ